MLKKQNAKSMLRLKNVNYAKKRKNIAILNVHHKENVIYIL